MRERPPEKLPRGFRPIWTVLSEADAQASSRQELARRLGVSTQTIQRILVDGDVPDFSREPSTRVRRSWIRTLTRLATILGHDPRKWIRAAGIRWAGDIPALVETEMYRTREKSGRRLSRSSTGADAMEQIRAAAGRGNSVEVGIADLRPFVDPLRSEPGSFFETLARRLVGALDPTWNVRARSGSTSDLTESLTRPDPTLRVAVGLQETAYLRGRGLAFLPLPGWELELGAVWVGAEGRAVLTWNEMVGRPRPGGVRFLVGESDPAWSHLRGQCGFPAEDVVVRRTASPEQLGDELSRMATLDSPAILVADEETCRRVRAHLARKEKLASGLVAREVPAAPGDRPRYPLGIAIRADSGRWLTLLREAWEKELFGASSPQMARLYADLVATGAFAFPRSRESRFGEYRGNVRLLDFPGADREFRSVFCRHLVFLLSNEPRVHLDVARLAWQGGGRRDAVAHLARSLIPESWRSSLDRALEEVRWPDAAPPAPAPAIAPGASAAAAQWYCDSCSASLLEHAGASDRYCRYCADEQGNLRPRDEVHELIAEWMATWQAGVSKEDTLDRAARFMSTMPAWSGN